MSGFPRPWLIIRIPYSSFLRAFVWPGAARASQVLNASLHAYHALRGPRQTLKDLASTGPLAWASGTLTPSPSALTTMSGLYQASGSAGSPAVYVVPCVRFNCVVRLYIFTSFTVATLGMSGWLNLTQQGLSPCKKRQASLGALTIKRNKRFQEPFDSLFCQPGVGIQIDLFACPRSGRRAGQRQGWRFLVTQTTQVWH